MPVDCLNGDQLQRFNLNMVCTTLKIHLIIIFIIHKTDWSHCKYFYTIAKHLHTESVWGAGGDHVIIMASIKVSLAKEWFIKKAIWPWWFNHEVESLRRNIIFKRKCKNFCAISSPYLTGRTTRSLTIHSFFLYFPALLPPKFMFMQL